MIATLKNFFRYRTLLYELVRKDIKIKYRRSILGYCWSLLNPLLMMVVVSSVFSYIFRNDIENYPIYLIIGQTVWSFFSESTSVAMRAIIDTSDLIKKIYIPKYILPLSKIISTFVNMFYSMIAVAIVIVVTGTKIQPTLILLPLGMLYILLFSAGLGILLSAIAVFFRDILHLYGVALIAWMYVTPIFYSPDMLSVEMQGVLRMNPMNNYVAYMRDIILYGRVPSLEENMVCLLIGVIFLALGLAVFKWKQDKMALNL